MKLLTKTLRKKLPPLNATANEPDPMVICKFFYPDFSWTWFAIEYDGDDIFFGLVDGLVVELGFFSKNKLEVNNPGVLGLPIERDKYFKPSRVEEPVHMPTQPIPLNDLEVWQHLFDSERGDFYASLCYGDLSVCGGDHSLAVIRLANQLAWMTDYDASRMRSLLYETKLVRPKWEEKRGSTTWIEYQIQDAIAYMSGRQT